MFFAFFFGARDFPDVYFPEVIFHQTLGKCRRLKYTSDGQVRDQTTVWQIYSWQLLLTKNTLFIVKMTIFDTFRHFFPDGYFPEVIFHRTL